MSIRRAIETAGQRPHPSELPYKGLRSARGFVSGFEVHLELDFASRSDDYKVWVHLLKDGVYVLDHDSFPVRAFADERFNSLILEYGLKEEGL
jgi:hypothetical protein